MLCAGIRIAERLHPREESHEPAKARRRRLEVLRNFEKLWALACGVAAETHGGAGVAGLRGYLRYVRPFLLSSIGRDQIAVADYNLLANQVRYGGIGTYGQMLEACHFVDWPTLTLRPLGDALADAFPSPPPTWSPEHPNVRLAKTTLCMWGEEVFTRRTDRQRSDRTALRFEGSPHAKIASGLFRPRSICISGSLL